MPDATVPIVIRTADDINATFDQVEALAIRSADVLWQELEDCEPDASAEERKRLVALVGTVLRHVLLDEPSTGDGVDIAGEQFIWALEQRLKEEEGLILREVDDGIDAANEAAAAINARLARLGLQLSEPAVEALWRAVGGLDVVEVEGQADG